MSEREGDWIQTYTGKKFWPLDPRPEEIDIEDIAHSLSLQCRFNGQSDHFYSISAHSVNVTEFTARVYHKEDQFWQEFNLDYAEEKIEYDDMVLWALLHDSAEAYCTDVPRPIKPYLTNYKEIENGIMDAVAQKFELPTLPEEHKAFLKSIDTLMLMVEHNELGMAKKAQEPWPCPPFLKNKWPTIKLIINESWEQDKLEFLSFFETLEVKYFEEKNN